MKTAHAILGWSMLLMLFLHSSLASAQGSKGTKPGSTTSNNVNVSIDETSGTISIAGDSASNQLYINVFNNQILISSGPWNQTTINGQSQNVSYWFYLDYDVAINVNLGGGNDRIWLNVSDDTNVYGVSATISGDDGADEIAVFSDTTSPFQLKGNLSILGGKGDDAISVLNTDIGGSLSIYAGDSNDNVEIRHSLISGSTTFDGGRGRDTLTTQGYLPWYGAEITGFETMNELQ